MINKNSDGLATYTSNTMAGWIFTEAEMNEARRGDRLLNPSIDLSNPCNLNCPYCFVEEKKSQRKIRFSDELSLQETLTIIHDFASAGAMTVNIVGAGEPTIDPDFKKIISEIDKQHMTPVVFTNGIRLTDRPELIDFLYESNATVVIKYNSSVPHIQDLVAGRKGYSRLRDSAIESLINSGFLGYSPTRLAFDIIAFQGVLNEIPDIVHYCRRNNIFPIVADFIPTGRTVNGNFNDVASLGTLELEDKKKVVALLAPPTEMERALLYEQLREIDLNEFHIVHHSNPAYYSGAPCNQILGVYVDIHGNIWPCVARSHYTSASLESVSLGNIRSGMMPSDVWKSHPWMQQIRSVYNGGCPYKPKISILGEVSDD